jgi:amidase
VPVAPHDDAWQGMSVNGPLARHVADAALFLDVTSTLPVPDGGFLGACASDPAPLRIAVSTKLPPGVLACKLDDDRRRALEDTAALLRDLGHQVVERDPDYPASLWPSAVARILRGIHDDVSSLMPNPDRLERRTRTLARMGGALPADVVRRARAAEAEQVRRVTAMFDDVDVLMTPLTLRTPYRVGYLQNRNAIAMFAEAPRRIAYAPAFNVTGVPACTVPAGFDADGLPTSVQLVAPAQQEERLFALAGQLERARPWADRRPALAS